MNESIYLLPDPNQIRFDMKFSGAGEGHKRLQQTALPRTAISEVPVVTGLGFTDEEAG
jgi:hypothetical protein